MRTSSALLFAGFCVSLAPNAQVTSEDLLKSPADNWLTYHGDYRGEAVQPAARDRHGHRRRPDAQMDPPLRYQLRSRGDSAGL